MGNERRNQEHQEVLDELNRQILDADRVLKEKFDWFSRQKAVVAAGNEVEYRMQQRDMFTDWEEARRRYLSGKSYKYHVSKLPEIASINIRVKPSASDGEAGCEAWRQVAHSLSWRKVPGVTDLRERENILPEYQKSYSKDDRAFSISLTCKRTHERITP